MSDTEAKILELLKKGWTYTQIQEELQVSSKTIAAVRKTFFLNTESNDTKLYQGLSLTEPEPEFYKSYNNPGETKPFINTLNKPKHMSREYEDDERSSKSEVERYRIKLAHELELEKLQAALREKEREFILRQQELELKRTEIANHTRKNEEEKRGLLFRIKKIVDSCEDGEYDFDYVDSLLEETEGVLSDCEKFCFMQNIPFPGTPSHAILNSIVSTLNDFLEETDEDDSGRLKFDSTFRRMVSRFKSDSF